jgi:transmembrane sensor
LSEKARSAAENSTNNVLKLKPNQKAVIQSDSSAPEIDVMDNDQLERELSWQYGFFSFENEPLGNVIKEVSRYTDIKLVISDPTIREIRVRGRYEVGAIDSLLESLELSFGVRVTRLESGVVYLSRQ